MTVFARLWRYIRAQRRTDEERPYPRIVYVPMRRAGMRVDHDTALTFSAVFAAVRFISQTIGYLSWHVMEPRADGGKQRVPDRAEALIGKRPNPEMSAMTFRETLLAWALTWGNGYAEIERDAARRPVALWPLTPDRVNPDRDNSGRLVYEVMGSTTGRVYLSPDDVFHLHGLGWDGRTGYSVVSYAARSIGMGIAADEFGGSFYGNSTVVSGVLKHPGKLGDTAYNRLKQWWKERHQGPDKAYEPAILEEGMEWQSMSMPLKDAEFIASRQFTVEDVARWFNIQPHKIGHLLRSTFSNIEHQSIETITDTLMPWVKRLEEEADYKLFGQNSRRFTKINVNALLRGDFKTRAEYYERMARLGVFSINDILGLEDMNPIPNGDTRIVPMNHTTLERLISGESESGNDGGDMPPGDDEMEEAQRTMRAVFGSTIHESIEVQQRRVASAARRYEDRDEFLEWREQFYANHADYLQGALLRASDAYIRAGGIAEPEMRDLIAEFIERHIEDLKSQALAYYDSRETHDAEKLSEQRTVEFVGALENRAGGPSYAAT